MLMASALPAIDVGVFAACVLGITLFGCSFAFRKDSDAEAFTTGKGTLPGWTVAFSIFATFVSSISFLGYPAKAFASDWNVWLIGLTVPISSFVAAAFFVPLYRRIGSPSCYAYLETRFGTWARVYASVCYLLTQMARTGTILFLLALPLSAMTNLPVARIVVATTVLTLLFSVSGGIRAVVWTDAIQGILMLVGIVVVIGILFFSIPDRCLEICRFAVRNGKCSLGSLTLTDWGVETFWVTFLFGTFVHLQDYGVDQNFVQRYLLAKTDREAVRSMLAGSLLYVPVSFAFMVIGSGLFAYYGTGIGRLPPEIAAMPDRAFPHFITTALPVGLRGLLVATVFAAGVSTVSTSLNSGATVMVEDFIKKIARRLSPKAELKILRLGTLVIALAGLGVAILLMNAKSAMDAWLAMQSIFSGGMLGLFLLGVCVPRARNAEAVIGCTLGIAVIAEIVLLRRVWPLSASLHVNLSIVFGTLVLFLIGFLLSLLRRTRHA